MRIAAFVSNLFGIPSLQMLLQEKLVCGVVMLDLNTDDTGRVRRICADAGLPLLPVTKKNYAPLLASWLKEIKADVVFVYTFPCRIPLSVLEIPRLGFYNFHFALLPQYRGAQPLFWEIRNREPFGGITIHKMEEGWDTGPVAIQEKVAILPTDTYGMHVSKLAFSAPKPAMELVNQLKSGNILLTEQDNSLAAYHPRPLMKDLIIDWENQDSDSINALIKASNPWNKGAFTAIRNSPVRILEVTNVQAPALPDAPAGTIFSGNGNKELYVICRDKQLLRVDIVCLEEGYFPGVKLLEFGIQPGEKFNTVAL